MQTSKKYWARTVPSDFYQAQALAKSVDRKGVKTLSTIAIINADKEGFLSHSIINPKSLVFALTGFCLNLLNPNSGYLILPVS